MRTLEYAQVLRERIEQISDPTSHAVGSPRHMSDELESGYDEVSNALASLDGSESSMVSFVSGLSRERLEELGGF